MLVQRLDAAGLAQARTYGDFVLELVSEVLAWNGRRGVPG